MNHDNKNKVNKEIRVSLLHLEIKRNNFVENSNVIIKAAKLARDYDPDIMITPEMAVSGLSFDKETFWQWNNGDQKTAIQNLLTEIAVSQSYVLIGAPEEDHQQWYNSVFVFDDSQTLISKQRKLNAMTDYWSSPGDKMVVTELGSVKAGILICADAYIPQLAAEIKKQGANLILAPSSWGKGLYEPNGEWEQRSLETGLPIFVCNRTGQEGDFSFMEAESSVIYNGHKLFSFSSETSAVITITYDLAEQKIIYKDVVYIDS